jgi:hypothetical protein
MTNRLLKSSLCLLLLTATKSFAQTPKEIKLLTLDPGHFHAALVQKTMYPQVNASVRVYAPEGADVNFHLGRIDSYNTRKDKPTAWKEIVYTGNDYFQKMLDEKAGNVVVIAGNNRIKAEYIEKSIASGFNVLADKPMIINASDFEPVSYTHLRAHETM